MNYIIMLTIEERKLVEKHIYGLVKKAVNENFNLLKEDENDKKNKASNKRKIVLKWLNSPELNQTAIMRTLWNPDKSEEDSKRSLFFKKLHGEPNDNGIPYEFSEEEITQLFNIKSHGVA